MVGENYDVVGGNYDVRRVGMTYFTQNEGLFEFG